MKSWDDAWIEQDREDASGHFHVRMQDVKGEEKKRIEELMAGMECPKDFKCMHSSSGDLCRARDSGLKNYIECTDHNRTTCKFILRFGGGYFCCCPLRVYFKKKLKR